MAVAAASGVHYILLVFFIVTSSEANAARLCRNHVQFKVIRIIASRVGLQIGSGNEGCSNYSQTKSKFITFKSLHYMRVS